MAQLPALWLAKARPVKRDCMPNGLEPFDVLRTPIGEQAHWALGLQPLIGAHVPPIPCADQRDPPGFPRPGGSVFDYQTEGPVSARLRWVTHPPRTPMGFCLPAPCKREYMRPQATARGAVSALPALPPNPELPL